MPDSLLRSAPAGIRFRQFEIALAYFEYGHVRLSPHAQRARVMRKSKRSRGIHRSALDHLFKRHPEMQKLRQGSRQIEPRTGYVKLVYVARDRAWQDTLLHGRFHHAPGEAAPAV